MKKLIENFARNKFIQGGMVLTATNFFIGFLNYLFNSLSGKLLGPAKYSEISALFAYLIIFAVPISVIQTEIIRRLGGKGKDRTSVIKGWENWFWSTFLRWKYIYIFFVLFFIFIVPSLTNLSLLFSITLMILIFTSLLSVFYTSALLGLHLFITYSFVLIFTTLTKLIGPILVYFHTGNMTTIALFITFSSIVLLVLSKIGIDYTLKNIKRSSKRIEKKLLQILTDRQIILTTLSIISIMLLNNLDVIFVKKTFSAEQAGIYGAWNLFSKIIYYLLSPILSITYIFFTSREFEKKHFFIFFLNSILLTILGILLFLIYLFGSDFLVRFIFSEKYSSLISILPQAAIFGTLFVAINFFNGYFIAKKSLISLTTLLFIPFYIFCLFFFGRKLESIVVLNLLFSTLIAVSYLILSLVKLNSHSKPSQRSLSV